MALEIEQFTAPGKFYIDLAMERIEEELKNTKPRDYINATNQQKKRSLFKDNPYYRMQNK